jgi:hypothetical protein
MDPISCKAKNKKGENCHRRAKHGLDENGTPQYCISHINYDPKSRINICIANCVSTDKICGKKAINGEYCRKHSKSPMELKIDDDEYIPIFSSTSWTKRELAKMKRLGIFEKYYTSDDIFDADKTIKETKHNLEIYFDSVDAEIKRIIQGAKIISEELNKAKLSDFRASEWNMFTVSNPQQFTRRESRYCECKTKLKQLKDIPKFRENKVSGLPSYDGIYELPDCSEYIEVFSELLNDKKRKTEQIKQWISYPRNIDLSRNYEQLVHIDTHNRNKQISILKEKSESLYRMLQIEFVNFILQYEDVLLLLKEIQPGEFIPYITKNIREKEEAYLLDKKREQAITPYPVIIEDTERLVKLFECDTKDLLENIFQAKGKLEKKLINYYEFGADFIDGKDTI